MKYQLTHTTAYDYGDPVSVSHHVARVTPRSLPLQDCHSHQIDISPSASLLREHVDHFGNGFHFFSLQTPHTCFTLTARSMVEVRARENLEPHSTPLWRDVKAGFLEENWSDETSVLEFIYASPLVPRNLEMAAYALESFNDDLPFLECLLALTARIHADFAYDPRATTVATPLAEVWKTRRGVCQDFAHLELACLRSLGIPARYVSGYLETMPPPGAERLTGADASHDRDRIQLKVLHNQRNFRGLDEADTREYFRYGTRPHPHGGREPALGLPRPLQAPFDHLDIKHGFSPSESRIHIPNLERILVVMIVRNQA